MNCIFVSKDNMWSNLVFEDLRRQKNVNWLRVSSKKDLNPALDVNPDWIFFFHWSYIVSENVWKNFNCVTFHTSNLPYDRGGSPIQNQILKGVKNSIVNAIKMSGDVDAGPIYCSKPVTLQGSLTDIWLAIADQTKILIRDCIVNDLKPTPQEASDINSNKRRKTSSIPVNSLSEIIEFYDHIRMLDAEGYPNASIKLGNFLIEFSRASIKDKKIRCDALIEKVI
jgi:methionyl-tRNA formyltransferase